MDKIGTYRSNVPTYAGTNKELLREGCVREKKNVSKDTEVEGKSFPTG